ncbi:MAG: hypothetical protein AAF611_17465 [Bacteroidota bacterium]
MTKQTHNNELKTGNKPTHFVYAKAYINGQKLNVKIGAAWKHSKGNGFNISLDDMVVFENTPKSEVEAKSETTPQTKFTS